MREISAEELRENFEHFDSDGDGRLELSEFVRLLQALDTKDTDKSAAMGFQAIDSDGSGRVEFDEFVQWFATR
ncbi:MAG: EF-hand domain-containing protein [Parahaliea sp.]